MNKSINTISIVLLLFIISGSVNAQSVAIGPRISGNFNIYNAQGATGTWNGIGVGIGGNVDIAFSQKLGILINLTVFDMKNFSNTITNGNTTQETSASMAYLTVDPLFKAEFSGFYMVAGSSVGIKLSSSGEQSTVVTGQTPNVQAINLSTNTVKFDIAVGTGYNFKLSQDLILGSDLIAYIPLSNTFDAPGVSNSVFTIKLGAALKFKL